jgi:hypothetical protein
MSKNLVYIIGDSFFNTESGNWIEQCFSQLNYEVKNWAYSGTGFFRQLDHLTQLEQQTDFDNIKYCVVGWSSPARLYDSNGRRDWSMGSILDAPLRHFENRTSWEIKRQALYELDKHDFFDYDYRRKIAKMLLEWTNEFVYKNKKYSHIKFINFYCVYEKHDQIIFDNQTTVVPSLFDYFSNIYPDIDVPMINHMQPEHHVKMAKLLSKIIQQSGENQKLVYNLKDEIK